MSAPTKHSVLIIDDDEQIRDLLRDLLAVDHNCDLAGSAEDALQLLMAK